MEKLFVKDAVDLSQKVVTLTQEATIEEALQSLRSNNIMSAPIVDDSGKAFAIIDVMDILGYLIKVTEQPLQTQSSDGRVSTSLHTDDIASIWERNSRFSCQKLVNLLHGQHTTFYPVTLDTPLLSAATAFAVPVHRLPVVDNEGKVINVFTQSQFLKFINNHLDLLNPDGNRSVSELGLGVSALKKSEIVQVKLGTLAIDAFKLIMEKKLSAIAVTDDSGLKSQISASDLRGISSNLMAPFNLRTLTLPVEKFIEIIRQQTHSSHNMLIWTMPGTKLSDVVQHIYKNHVHRVYMIDGNTKLYGVVSITDIARFLVTRKQDA